MPNHNTTRWDGFTAPRKKVFLVAGITLGLSLCCFILASMVPDPTFQQTLHGGYTDNEKVFNTIGMAGVITSIVILVIGWFITEPTNQHRDLCAPPHAEKQQKSETDQYKHASRNKTFPDDR